MGILKVRYLVIVFLGSLLVACEPPQNETQSNANELVPIINGGSVSPGAEQPATNPRFPGVKTYGTLNGGYYSIVKASSLSITSGQSLFGMTARGEDLVLAFKRTDSSNIKWIDIYSVPVASYGASFVCKIHDDGNFSSGLRFDQSFIYIKNSSYPAKYRKFSWGDCAESTSKAEPNTPSNWSICGNWDFFNGLLHFCSISNTYGQSVRSYNESTGKVEVLVDEVRWNDFDAKFSLAGIAVTPRGVWGLKFGSVSIGLSLFLIESSTNKGNWTPLPKSDYPDFAQSISTSLYMDVDDGKNLYVAALNGSTIRYYLIDVTSF